MGSTLGACGDVNRNVTGAGAPYKNKPEYVLAQKYANDIADLLAPQSGAYYDVWLDGEKFVSVYKEVGWGGGGGGHYETSTWACMVQTPLGTESWFSFLKVDNRCFQHHMRCFNSSGFREGVVGCHPSVRHGKAQQPFEAPTS